MDENQTKSPDLILEICAEYKTLTAQKRLLCLWAIT
jgi:hypothetical protein